MIIARITDGLGNQLFQYAAARRLAHAHDTTLLLDTRSYGTHSFRRYELDQFRVVGEPLRLRDLMRIAPGEALLRWVPDTLGATRARIPLSVLHGIGLKSRWDQRILEFDPSCPLPPLLQGRIVSQRHFHFDSAVLSAPNNVAMCGYWQSEGYFADIAETIRRELTLKSPLAERNLACARLIEASPAVSLHVRRGDKVNWPMFPSTTLEFCRNAISWFHERIGSVRFFVFSDDHAWVSRHLQGLADLVIVDHNGSERAAEDLRLMSLCQHNIIAPSSLSWWGAWLNSNPDKIVVSPHPRNWVNAPNVDTKDVLPDSWEILDDSPPA